MRFCLIPALVLALLSAAACKRVRHPNPEATVEEEAELAGSIRMADPRDASQLLSGFYNLEQNAWRWTTRQFSVSLATPRPPAARPGRLEFQFTIPDVVAADLAGVAVQASVDGKPLGTYRAARAGEQVAVFPVPPELMQTDALIVDFALDKTVPKTDAETRELGVIALRFSLVAP